MVISFPLHLNVISVILHHDMISIFLLCHVIFSLKLWHDIISITISIMSYGISIVLHPIISDVLSNFNYVTSGHHFWYIMTTFPLHFTFHCIMSCCNFCYVKSFALCYIISFLLWFLLHHDSFPLCYIITSFPLRYDVVSICHFHYAMSWHYFHYNIIFTKYVIFIMWCHDFISIMLRQTSHYVTSFLLSFISPY